MNNVSVFYKPGFKKDLQIKTIKMVSLLKRYKKDTKKINNSLDSLLVLQK